MKTLKSKVILAAIGFSTIFFTSNAYAFFNVVPMNHSEKAIVKVEAPVNEDTYVVVNDSKGNTLHKESIKAGNMYAKYFNFSELDNGIYTFYSEIEHSTMIKKIKVENSNVKVISKEVEFRPVFKIQGDNLMVNYLNTGAKDIEFTIETDDAVYYNGEEGSSAAFHKNFNIEQLPRDTYYASLKTGGSTFRYTFETK